MTSRDDYWPEGEAYQTPVPDPKPHPVCEACGARHLDPLPWCRRVNKRTDRDG